ncbi:hypothetical protein MOB65_19080 [Bacillus inaquosorum]|uniref:hypothetical protein n=1 Tax=Bacillus inaquosorum TaxID=483913 RepID=UPI0022818DF1|nr:hypothetical protein [Bacillus inaquosorum]MCY7751603.1 hypothetical protein [Bacillus inaquosorum]MCY7910967.1 hypothetical protein [Bacillus inaquosorum]
MFKQRLFGTLIGLIAMLVFIGIFVAGFSFVHWLMGFEAVQTTVAVIVLLGLLLIVLSVIITLVSSVIEFINWLIVEPYRNHKRKRETEGPVE